MSILPKILHKSIVSKSRLFCIEGLSLQFANGERREYERLIRAGGFGAVMIVPLLDDETVLLVREYAAGLEKYELGLPKGRMEAGEDALMAANRELQEEVGYGADELQWLTKLSLAPSYMEHDIDVVIASNLYPQKLPGDEPEELEVVPWKLNALDKLLASGECSEARTIAGLYLVRDFLNSQ